MSGQVALRPSFQGPAQGAPERISKPPPLPQPAELAYVDPNYVRLLYQEYARVVGPVAKLVFEAELRALGRLPNTLTAQHWEILLERLTARIPVTSARARFMAAVHELLS